jgi:type IV secretion system protein VirB9
MKRRLVLCALLVAMLPVGALAQPAEIPAIGSDAGAHADAHGASARASFSAAPADPGRLSGAEVPHAMPPPLPALSPDKPLTHWLVVVVEQASRGRQRAARAQVDATGWIHFAFGDGEPFVVCAPLHICDVRLQPGERVLEPPDLSDPRWIVHPRYSVEDGQTVTHVIVKPSDDGLDGNIVIHTDRRTYSIGLISSERQYMPLVAFDYPDDGGSANADGGQSWNGPAATAGSGAGGDPCDATPVVPPSAFRVTGPKQAWTPVQVYVVSTPVGEKTCVDFASDIGSGALPAVVALGHDGSWFSDPTPHIVNVRYVRRRFEVDEAMDRFALISGVGDDQQKNEIRRAGP